MSSLVDFLRQADPRYNNVSDVDLITQTGDAARQDPAAWDALRKQFPDFESQYNAARDTQSDWLDARNSFLRGALDGGIMQPAEGLARAIGTQQSADYWEGKRKDVAQALPVDSGFAESKLGQVTQGLGMVLPTVALGYAGGAAGNAAMAEGGAEAAEAGRQLGQVAATVPHTVGMTYQMGVDDAKAMGVTDPKVLAAAGRGNLPGAMVGAIAENYVLNRIFRPLAETGVRLTPMQLVQEAGKAAAAGGLTMAAQTELTNYVAAKVAKYDPNRPLDKHFWESAGVGAAVGGITGAAGATARNFWLPKATDEANPQEAAQNVLERKQDEMANATTPAAAQDLAGQVSAVQAAVDRDNAKANGVNLSSASQTLDEIRSNLTKVTADPQDVAAEQASIGQRMQQIQQQLDAISQQAGPEQEATYRDGKPVVTFLRSQTDDERALYQEAGALQQRLQELSAVSQQQSVEGATAGAAEVDPAVERAMRRVGAVQQTALAKEGDAVVAQESGQVAPDFHEVAANGASAIQSPEPASGAGSAPDVDAGAETAPAPAQVEQPAPVQPAEPAAPPRAPLSSVLDQITKYTPPLALDHEPLTKAKTRVSGDAKSEDPLRGRTIIALKNPETGEVYLRNYYFKDGEGYAENMGRRGSSRGVSVTRLVNDGWQVQDHPWLLSEPAEVNHQLKPEEYEAWKQQNKDLLSRVQETQREGTPASFFNDLLSETSPKTVNAVNYLVSTLAAESGAEPSSLYAGVLRPFSESDDTATNRAQREQVRFISEARRDPSKMLRDVDGKVLGIFTPDQFGAFTDLVNEGRVDEADAMVSKLAGKAAVFDDEAQTEANGEGRGGKESVEGVGKKVAESKEEVGARRLKAWATNMANLGREALAYWAPGESRGRLVSADAKTSEEGPTVAESIAADGPSHPEEVIDNDIQMKDREGLRNFGMPKDEVNFALSELADIENPSYQDVHDVIEYNPEQFANFLSAVRSSENPRAVVRGAVDALQRIASSRPEGVAGDSAVEAGGRADREGRSGVQAGDGNARRGGEGEESRPAAGGSEARPQDVAARPADQGTGAATVPAGGAGEHGSESSGGVQRPAEDVTPKSPERAKAITSVEDIPESKELDALLGDVLSDIADDTKFSEPSGPVRVGGQEKASVLEKLTKALAMLVQSGVRSFSAALQRIAKGVGVDTAMSVADHLRAKWNEWRSANPHWGLDKPEDGTTALTGVKAIRPPLQDLGQGKYPNVQDLVRNRYGKHLGDEQKLGVNLMLNAAARGAKGFLLGDSTGVGKTRQIFATADTLREYGSGRPVLILTENRTILDGNFTNDARAMGLVSANGKLSELKGIHFATYTGLAQGHVPTDHYAAIFLDEAHKLRNPNSAAHLAESKLKRNFTVYSTATPLDEIYQSIYFLSGITGKSSEELEQRIGVRVKWDKDPFTGNEVPQIESVPGVSEAQATENLKALRDEAMQQGLIVRRMYPFFGKMELMPVQITPEQRAEEMRIMASHQDAIDEAPMMGGGRGDGVRVPGQLSVRAKLSGQRTLDLARWTESQKANAVFADMKKELAAGKQVVVMSDSSGPRMIQGLGGKQIDGLLDTLASMLEAEKVPYVDIRGAGNKAPAVADFQSGKMKVALATIRSGGTGINLDDTTGNAPRVAYVASLPFSALEYDQLTGRFSRRNTQSPAHIKFVFLADQDRQTGNWRPASLSESRRVSNLSRKLTLMRMMQGQKVDFDDIFGPMGNSEENERRLLTRTFSAPELGEDAQFSQPSGYKLPFEEEEVSSSDDPSNYLDDIVQELMAEGHTVHVPDAEIALGGGESREPSPGKFKVQPETDGSGKQTYSIKYNLDDRFIVAANLILPPKRGDYESRRDYNNALAGHETFVDGIVGPATEYLPEAKRPKSDQPFASITFYDKTRPFDFSEVTGAGGSDVRSILATKSKLLEAANRVAEEATRRFGVKHFWLGEGSNRHKNGEIEDASNPSARTRIYAKERLSGAFKYSEPITAKDLPMMDRSWLQPPSDYNFDRYQRTKALLSDRGTDVREMQAFVEHASGAFSASKSAIWLTADNFLTPSEELVGVLGHEVVHDLFRDVPAVDKVRILRAVARENAIKGSRFDIDPETNRSLTHDGRTGQQWEQLGMAGMQAKWEEHLAEGFRNEGVADEKAGSYAQRLARTIRAVVYNTAKFMLEKVNRFGWTEQQLDRIALELFHDRLRRFAAGELEGRPKTIDDYTGGVQPTPEWRAKATDHPRAVIDPTAALPAYDESTSAFNVGKLIADLAMADKESKPVGDTDRPEERVHQNLAPINHQLVVEGRVLNALGAPFAGAAQALNRTPSGFFRSLFGLPDLDGMKADTLNIRNPKTGLPIPGVDPAHLPDSFRNEGLRAEAKRDSYEAVGRQRQLVSDQLQADKGRIALLNNRRSRFVADFDEARRNYLNADGLTSVMMRSIRQMLSEERQKLKLAYTRRGIVMQQLRDLDARPVADIERSFGNVITRVMRNEISGRQFFDLLDGLRDSGIDYKGLRASEVKRALADKNLLPSLTANTDESKVLLSTVLAFAKTHDHIMEKLELRRQKSADERKRIEDELNKLAQTKMVSTQRAINALPRTAKLEDRLKQTYLEAKRRLKQMGDEIDFVQHRMDAAKTALPVYDKALGELGAEIGARANVHFGHGTVINNPLKDNASPDEVTNSRFKILLDTNGAVTDRDALLNVVANQERWMAWRRSTGAIDPLYLSIKAQHDEVLRGITATQIAGPFKAWKRALMIAPVADRMSAIGTPLARSVGSMVNQFSDHLTAMRQQSHRLAYRSEVARDAAMALLPKGLTLADYKALFLDPAKGIIEKEKGVLEDQALTPEQARTRVWVKVENALADNPTARGLMGANKDAFIKALRAHVDADHDVNTFYHDFSQGRMGMGVRDERVRVLNPATGKWEEGVRDSFTQGTQTFSRTLSPLARQVYRKAVDLGWGGFSSSGIAEMYGQKGPDAVRSEIAKYVSDPMIQRGLIRPMVENEVASMFDAPVLPDGRTRPEADTDKVRAAWQASKGDLVNFAEHLYDLHGGTQGKAKYVEEVLGTIAKAYGSLATTMREIDPAGAGVSIEQIKGMVPGFQIESRVWERMPSQWSTYHTFDRLNTSDFNHRVAAQVAFGRDQERLHNAFTALAGEVQRAQDSLSAAIQQAKQDALARGRVITKKSDIEKAVIASLGADEYKRLRAITDNAILIEPSRRGLIGFFHQDTQGAMGVVRGPLQAAQAIAWGLVQQPTAALLNLADVFSPIMQQGFSPMAAKQAVRMMKAGGSDVVGALGEHFGLQLGRQNHLEQAYRDLGLNDGEVEQRFLRATKEYDPVDPSRKTDAIPRVLRKWVEYQSFNINKAVSEHTGIRPLAPFTTSAIVMNRAATIAMWQTAEDLVLRGLEHFKANPVANADPTYRVTAADLKLKGLDAESFSKLEGQFMNHGLDLTRMVREAQARLAGPANKRTLISDNDRILLHGLAGAEIQLESNLATMAPGAYTNPAARMALPLLGWSLRRAQQIPALFKTANGSVQLKTLGLGAMALAAAAVPGLMYSYLIDQFQKDVLGKARNLPSVDSVFDSNMSAGDRAMVAIENLNRVGTFGMFGDLLNTATSSMAGQGDNRSISLDQRVVAANAAFSLLHAVNTFINQGGKVDYAGVIRPLVSSMGGNGYLQWEQIANNLFDLDNPEARFVRRVNVLNELRVYGRMNELDIKPSTAIGSGGSASTRVTPHLVAMQLAALSDNYDDFVTEWKKAVAATLAAGQASTVREAEADVKRSLQARHPLRSVFRSISSEQYSQMLSNMDDRASGDVQAAVDAFNRYGRTIGISPYYGGKEKPAVAPIDMDESDIRAAMLGL